MANRRRVRLGLYAFAKLRAFIRGDASPDLDHVCTLLAVVLRRVIQRFDASLYVFFCVGCSKCTETLLQPRVQTFWSATQQFSCDRVE